MIKQLGKVIISLFDRLSLVKKLILSYILILLIPVVIFGVYYYITFKTDTEVEALRECQHAVQQAEININQNIEMCVRAALTVTGNKGLLDFVSTSTFRSYSTEDLIAFKDGPLVNIENFQNANTNIYQLRFFVSNHNFPEIWPVIYSEDRILQSDWRSKVLDLRGGYFWRLNHPEESMQPYKVDIGDVVSLYCEVKDHSNEYAGVLEVNMLARDFFADMYSPLQDENSFMCVRDKNNRMMWNTESNFLNNTPLDEQWIQAELVEGSRGPEGNFTLENKGQTLMVAYEYIKLIDCYVYQITSISDLIKKIGRTRNTIILGSLAAIIILSVVTYFMTSIILIKMKKIIASMRKVQEGDLNIEIPSHGSDEIGELAYHFGKMLYKINELIVTVVKKQTAAKDAEIRALQSQINAHFIYNVLENIKMMAEIEYRYEIADAIVALGGLLRYSMSWTKQYVLLEEEINYIKNYINIANIRYDDVIELKIDVDQVFMKHIILKMLLQPIVENAVNHGIKLKGGRGILVIKAFASENVINIEVSDNGAGMEPQQLEVLRRKVEPDYEDGEKTNGTHGIGLKNINERIKLFYGKEFGLEIESEEQVFTKVRITIPYMKVPGR